MALKGAQGSVKIIDKATKPLQNIAKSFLNMGNSSKKANTELNGTQKAINGLSSAQNRLGRIQANNKRQTGNIGGQAVGIAAMGLAFKNALNPAIKFEQSMKNLEAVAFGNADATVDVAASMKLLSEQAKQLGATTAFSATQAADGQLFLAKAGFQTNEILNAMSPLLDLAAASQTDLGRASDITSDLLGAFGLQAKDTGKLADVLAAATSSANVDMETLFETLKVAAPIGVAAGQSMESMVAATALLGNVGIKGSNAGTALKNALTNLASPAANGAKILKELGMVAEDSNGQMLPLQQIMMNLGRSAKSLSQTKQIKVFSGVFGKEAMAGAINLEKAINSGDFSKMLKNLENSEGVAKKMAAIQMDSTEGSIKALNSAVESVAITFGSLIIPALSGFAKIVTSLGKPLNEWIENNEGVVKGATALFAILGVGKLLSLAFTASLWLISPALTALKISLGATAIVMKGLNLVWQASPLGAVITGVTLLTVAGVALYTQWDKITNIFSELWETLKAFDFSNIMGSIGKIADTIGLGGLFGDDKEISATQNINPQQAISQIQSQNTNNNNAIINVNVQKDKISAETSGDFKTNVFLNSGEQD